MTCDSHSSIKITVLWDMTPCSLVDGCQCFGGTFCI